ncbi:MAG TPA: aconitase X, partial [Planctomycetota bacterium]|nr:aconitase X [Planctomycetota bacterium]
MRLTDSDRRMLDGGEGRLIAEAMRFLVRLGEAFDAAGMIDLDYAYVYIDCMEEWGSGELSQDLLSEGLAAGVRCRIPTTTWVSGRELDDALYGVLGIGERELAALAKESEIGRRLGMVHVDTCAPYLMSDLGTPAFGAHVASIESSAVAYFNTAMGVRTNRDGISAFFAALTGRYPAFGMHLDANRRGTLLFDVTAPMRHSADYSALGYVIGKRSGLAVPVIRGVGRMSIEEMQCLTSALAVGGAVSLAHVVGVTPEAPTLEAATGGRAPVETFEVAARDIRDVYDAFSSPADTVDFVCLGCPHASIHDLKRYAERFRGSHVAAGVTVWLMTAPQNIRLARESGELDDLTRAGVHVLMTCPMVNPGVPGPFHTFHHPDYSIGNFATNSMKLLYYSRNCLRPRKTFFGSTEQCIRSALSGRWVSDDPFGGAETPLRVNLSNNRRPLGRRVEGLNETRTLVGKVVVAGECTAEALVAHEPVSFLGMVNTETGTFDCPGHELEGRSIAGKVLVYPHGKGSSGDTIRMWRLDKFGLAPAGILFQEAEPIHVQGAMLLEVPTLYGPFHVVEGRPEQRRMVGFGEDVCRAIKTGDLVTIKGDT